MNSAFKRLNVVVTALALFTTSLSLSLPAKASLPCSNGTISSYQNGSVSSCVIDADVSINTGNFSLTCQQGNSVYFDEKARLTNCTLSKQIEVRKDSEVEVCHEKSRVNVSYLKDGSQYFICQGL